MDRNLVSCYDYNSKKRNPSANISYHLHQKYSIFYIISHMESNYLWSLQNTQKCLFFWLTGPSAELQERMSVKECLVWGKPRGIKVRKLRGEQVPFCFCKMNIPVVVSDQHPRQPDVMAWVRLTLADCSCSFFYHVQQHLWQLRVLIEIDKVWQTVVHLKCNSCFLGVGRKINLNHKHESVKFT